MSFYKGLKLLETGCVDRVLQVGECKITFFFGTPVRRPERAGENKKKKKRRGARSEPWFFLSSSLRVQRSVVVSVAVGVGEGGVGAVDLRSAS